MALRCAVILLGFNKYEITADRVSTYSVHTGGSMALKFAGADRDDIKKMGQLSSDTWLVYIHDQIVEYSEGWTRKMANPCSYYNLEGGLYKES